VSQSPVMPQVPATALPPSISEDEFSLDIPLVIKAGCSIIPLLAKLAFVNELNLMRGTSHVYLVVDKAQSLPLYFIYHQLPLLNPIQLHHLLDHHHSQMKEVMTTCLLDQL